MRADVKEIFFPLPFRREMDVAICIQLDLRSGEALGSRRARDRPRQSAVSTRRFHDAMVRRLRFRKLRKQTGWALKICQPWSSWRLEAYRFVGLCEGA